MADSPSTVLGSHRIVSQVSDNDGGRRGSTVTFESRMNFTLKSFFSFSSIISQGAGGRQGGFAANNGTDEWCYWKYETDVFVFFIIWSKHIKAKGIVLKN